MQHRTNPGFSLPLTLIFLVIFSTLFLIFGWIVFPIATGIFLLITASLAIQDWIKRKTNQKYRPHREALAFDPKLSRMNLILYRAIFNRSEEQAKLNSPSLRLADLHPFAGNPTEEEIRALLTMVLREIVVDR